MKREPWPWHLAHHVGPVYPPHQARTFTGGVRMVVAMWCKHAGLRLCDWIWPGDAS